MELSAVLVAQLVPYILVFARLGSVMIFMPGFGDTAIPMRMRLMMALVISVALTPASGVPAVDLAQPMLLVPLLAIEVTVGLWIGLTARILFSALDFAGAQVAYVAGLSNALAPQTGQFQGATMISGVLTLAATAMIFATDLHHLILRALLLSYEVFPTGRLMPGDLAQQTVRAASASFSIGLSIAAPFYVMGLVLNAGLGLTARMMPQLPVFFVATPVLIVSGLFVLVLAAPAMLSGWAEVFAGWLGRLSF
ncbi:flagellar biosynthetic protein FliR [Pseudoroseicyclus aestuarii]|uniref:Flagellar biosynthetic protein FliR n=1 Tax=Pseudoroseicyclus aestuarii TaxID=1795041 RepID=A0A318T2Q7_9RHOB|nr:flagellar biosynthetic protein FliR [Pseudoroseicyclus aestuarii]PYE84504.1 flagellar biosynthetic protein FliR [Pseudoroseicyclus aestuarii]